MLYIGVSDAAAWWISRANTIAELRGWTSFVGLQIEYSLLERTPERELLPMAQALGITVTAWSPLASGLLTGKYRISESGVQSEDGKSRMDNPELQQFMQNRERTTRVIAVLKEVAAKAELSPAEVALAWLRHRGQPIIPIVGARRIEQLQANLRIVDIRLPEAEVQRLDEASKIELGFPHDFLEKPMVRAFTFGGLGDRIVAR